MLVLFIGLSFSITRYGGMTGFAVGDLTYGEGKRTIELNYLDAQVFYVNGQRYVAVVGDAQNDFVKININPGTTSVIIKDGETQSVDVNKNGYDDLKITLTKINFVNGKPLGGTFDFEILDEKYIQEQEELEFNKLAPLTVPEAPQEEAEVSAPETNIVEIPEIVPEEQLSPAENKNKIIFVSTGIAIIVLMVLFVMLTKKKNHRL